MNAVEASVRRERAEPPLSKASAISRLDMAIATVFPKWGAGRLKARREFAWEAARSTRLRKSAGQLQGPEDYTVFADRIQLMRQSRWVEQNMGLAQSIIDKLAMYAFGRMRYRPLGADKKANIVYDEYLKERFKTIDMSGRHTLRDLTCLCFKSMIRDGDYGEQWRNTFDGLKLTGVESDRIGGISTMSADENYFQGITVDLSSGRPTSFKVFKRGKANQYMDPVDVPAADFIHFFDPRRVDQYRGITPLAPVLNEMTDLKEVLEDCRIGTKFENRHAALHYTDNGLPLGSPSSYVEGTEEANGNIPITQREIFPGLIQTVPASGKVEFIKSQRPSGDFQMYLETLIRLVGIALNMPWGFLYKLSDLNGPCTRMDAQQAQRMIIWHQDNMVSRRLSRIVRTLMLEGFATGAIPYRPDWQAGSWQFAPALSIDAGRDSNAMCNEYKLGLTSKDNIFGENGEDAEEEEQIIEQEADRQIKRALRLSKENGISYEQAMNELAVRVPNGLTAPQQVTPADGVEKAKKAEFDWQMSDSDVVAMSTKRQQLRETLSALKPR